MWASAGRYPCVHVYVSVCVCVCPIYPQSTPTPSVCITVLAASTDGKSFLFYHLFPVPSTPKTCSDRVWRGHHGAT